MSAIVSAISPRQNLLKLDKIVLMLINSNIVVNTCDSTYVAYNTQAIYNYTILFVGCVITANLFKICIGG